MVPAPDMELPVVGQLVRFLYPDDRTFRHGVYDDFPWGNLVRAHVAFVDFNRPVRVEEIREEWFPAPRQRGGRRRRRGPPQEVLYTGIRFTSVNGTVLWTNYARGDSQWMEINRVEV